MSRSQALALKTADDVDEIANKLTPDDAQSQVID
jgi:hypothetical protein